jgi:hypothetical protein
MNRVYWIEKATSADTTDTLNMATYATKNGKTTWTGNPMFKTSSITTEGEFNLDGLLSSEWGRTHCASTNSNATINAWDAR